MALGKKSLLILIPIALIMPFKPQTTAGLSLSFALRGAGVVRAGQNVVSCPVRLQRENVQTGAVSLPSAIDMLAVTHRRSLLQQLVISVHEC